MTQPPNESVFSATPPTKPGWYWCKDGKGYSAFGNPIYPIELRALSPGSTVMLFRADQILQPQSHLQWDPTPILGPGELQKVVREAYREAYREGYLEGCSGHSPNPVENAQQAWQDSNARAVLEGR